MRPYGIVAFVGFLMSIAVHALTFTSVATMRVFPAFLLVGVGILIVFPATVFDMQRRFGRTRFTGEESEILLAPIPRNVRMASGCVLIYVVLNFFLCLQFLHDSPQYTFRLVTGHFLIFYLVPAVYFRYIAAKR